MFRTRFSPFFVTVSYGLCLLSVLTILYFNSDSTARPISKVDFAKAVSDRYVNMKSLSFVVNVRHDTMGVSAICFMEPRKLWSQISDTKNVPMALFILNDGVMTEYGDRFVKDDDGGVCWNKSVYDPSSVRGVSDPVYKNDLGCLYGSYLSTWVGADGLFPNFIVEKISESRSIEIRNWEQRVCVVVEWSTYDNLRKDDFWFDPNTHLLIRWTTSGETPEEFRERVYSDIVVDKVIPNIWSEGPRESQPFSTINRSIFDRPITKGDSPL